MWLRLVGVAKLILMANADDKYLDPMNFQVINPSVFQPLDRPLVIGVGGGSGSGKTTLAQALLEVLGIDNITYIPHDNYYKDLSHMTHQERDNHNFDHPHALDTNLLIDDLVKLKNHEPVKIPRYDFKTHTRMSGLEEIFPRRVILIEGVLIFTERDLVNQMDIKIFVDTEADLRFIRRMQRDIRERDRTPESVISQYLTTVRPMHELFVEPSKRHADIIIPSGYNAVALELVAHRLRSAISTSPSQSGQTQPVTLSSDRDS